jgi:hypothetical protein
VVQVTTAKGDDNVDQPVDDSAADHPSTNEHPAKPNTVTDGRKVVTDERLDQLRKQGFQAGNKHSKGSLCHKPFDVYAEIERAVKRLKRYEAKGLIEDLVRKRPELAFDALVKRALKENKSNDERQVVFIETEPDAQPPYWRMPSVGDDTEYNEKRHEPSISVAVSQTDNSTALVGMGL